MSSTNNTIQAFWLGIGSLFAFLFSIVSTMILSRYLDKADYGTYRQALYVYNILLAVFTLGIPKAYAYFLPRVPENEARALIKKITSIFYDLGFAFSFVLFVSAPLIAKLLNNNDLVLAIRVFSPTPFLLLPTMGIEGIFATYNKNQFMALYNVMSKLFILMCVVLPVVLFNGGCIDALIGFVLASLCSLLFAIYLKNRKINLVGRADTAISLKQILIFAKPLLAASLWGILFQASDGFFISRFYGEEVYAEFSNGSLELPFVAMVISACSTVLLPLFSRKQHESQNPKEEIFPIWKSVFEKTIKITYPLVLFFVFFAEIIMVILYGENYSASGIFFKLKLFVNFFTVISYFPILLAIGASKFYRNTQMIGAISLIIFSYLSVIILKNPYVITMISTICLVAMILVMIRYIARYFEVGFFKIIPLRLMVKILLPSIIMLFVTKEICIKLFENNLVIVISSFVVYGISYLAWSKIAKIDYQSLYAPLFYKIKK